MRLLNTRTGRFHWFNNLHEVRYAILSHVWSQDGEQSFQELLVIQQQDMMARQADPTRPLDAILLMASPKIREACTLALAHGFHYIWIDSCCIDKSSSPELSEAIISMYSWYANSTVCFAFLHDVDGNEDPFLDRSTFRESRWFTRGWTLQELIAPSTVTFVSSSWRPLGTKATFSGLIKEITNIDEGILLQSMPLSAVSVARRMSWASGRVTSRKEDEAYCLMGIFDVQIPVLYGEGVRAFIRLQEEILKRISDQSIFLWERTLAFRPWERQLGFEDRYFAESGIHFRYDALLSPAPALFSHSGDVQSIKLQTLAQRLQLPIFHPIDAVTPSGLHTSFPVVALGPRLSLAILACEDQSRRLLALVLRRSRHGVYSVGATVCQIKDQLMWNVDIVSRHAFHTLSALSLSPEDIQRLSFQVMDVVVRHRPDHGAFPSLNLAAAHMVESEASPASLKIILADWSISRLATLGFKVELSRNDVQAHILTISSGASCTFSATISQTTCDRHWPWLLRMSVRPYTSASETTMDESWDETLPEDSSEHVHLWPSRSPYIRFMTFSLDSPKRISAGPSPTIAAIELAFTCGFNPFPPNDFRPQTTELLYYLTICPSSGLPGGGPSDTPRAIPPTINSVDAAQSRLEHAPLSLCETSGSVSSEGWIPMVSPIFGFSIYRPSKKKWKMFRSPYVSALLDHVLALSSVRTLHELRWSRI